MMPAIKKGMLQKRHALKCEITRNIIFKFLYLSRRD